MRNIISILFLLTIICNSSSAQPTAEWLISDFISNPPKNAVIIGNPGLTGDGQWYLDAFIQSGEVKIILKDPAKLHPLGQW